MILKKVVAAARLASLMAILLSLSAFLLVNPAFAYTSFQPTCTLSNTTVNVVLSPGVRETYDILWSSLFTLLICTWTIQHLNIPYQTRDPATWKETFKENLSRSWARLKWMILTLIIPEFFVGKALQDFMRARKYWREMQEFARVDGVNWTITHSFYADMGGIVYLRDYSLSRVSTEVLQSSETEALQSPHTEVYQSPQMEVYQLPQTEVYQSPEAAPERGERDRSEDNLSLYCTNAEEMVLMRRDGVIPKLPNITEKEINDKSKGDVFVKGIALVQVLWLIIQIISRDARHIHVSQLEIGVLAYSACAILTYVLSWYKPQNVGTHFYTKEVLGAQYRMYGYHTWGLSWFNFLLPPWRNVGIGAPVEFPNDFVYTDGPFGRRHELSYLNVGFVLGGTIFGGLHCIAWNYQFPSELETLLWRISAIISTVGLPIYYAGFVWSELPASRDGFVGVLDFIFTVFFGMMVNFFIVFAYIFARFCLIVLAFRALFYLPPDAFLTTWSSQVPHI